MKSTPIRVTTNQLENNLFITTSKNKPKAGVSIIPYENELFRQEENDLFMSSTKKNRQQQRSERNNRSLPTLTRSQSKNHYKNNNNSNNIRQKKRQKYNHSRLQTNVENEEDDFQEINRYINKYSKNATTKEDKTTKKKNSNNQNKNDHVLSRKMSNNSSSSSGNKNDIKKPYSLRSPSLLSTSSLTTVRTTPKSLISIPKTTKRELLLTSNSTSMDEKHSMKKPISLSIAKRLPRLPSKKEDTDADDKPDDDSNNSNSSSSIRNSINNSSDTNSNNDEKNRNKTEICKENFLLPEKRPRKSKILFAPLPSFSDPLIPEKLRSSSKKLGKLI